MRLATHDDLVERGSERVERASKRERNEGEPGGVQGAPADKSMNGFWRAREFSTVMILLAEVLFFAWYLWPEQGRSHPFMNLGNVLLIFKYSSIYGIAAIGAAS
jgi:hypothetical protein